MRFMLTILSFAAAVSLPAWVSAQPLTVNPVTATTFEVIEQHGAGPEEMWCAAALYAEGQLGENRGRLYLAGPYGPAKTAPGEKGAIFSIEPIAGGSSGGSVSVSEVGYNLLVNGAIEFCEDGNR